MKAKISKVQERKEDVNYAIPYSSTTIGPQLDPVKCCGTCKFRRDNLWSPGSYCKNQKFHITKVMLHGKCDKWRM